jgi:hypothetical protein
MHIPAFDAELALTHRASFTGNGVNDLTVEHLQVKITSTTAVSAGRQYGFVLHVDSSF